MFENYKEKKARKNHDIYYKTEPFSEDKVLDGKGIAEYLKAHPHDKVSSALVDLFYEAYKISSKTSIHSDNYCTVIHRLGFIEGRLKEHFRIIQHKSGTKIVRYMPDYDENSNTTLYESSISGENVTYEHFDVSFTEYTKEEAEKILQAHNSLFNKQPEKPSLKQVLDGYDKYFGK